MGVPVYQGEYASISPAVEVLFEVYSEKGVWSFKTPVTIDKAAIPPVMRFKKPLNAEYSNKRHSPRVKLQRGQAEFRVEPPSASGDASAGRNVKACLKDVSYDSACIVSPAILAIGTVIDLSFVLPYNGGRDQRQIDVKAEVMRVAKDISSGECDLGVTFLVCDTPDHEFLKIFVDDGGRVLKRRVEGQ